MRTQCQYPVISEEYRVKGCVGNYYLLSLNSYDQFVVNDFQARIIQAFNGNVSIAEIISRFKISQEAFFEFIQEVISLGAVKIISDKKMQKDNLVSPLQTPDPYLKELHLDITSKCNLRCLHCYQAPYINPMIKDMSTEEIKDLIDQAAKMNIEKIAISGGEPFLRDDLFDIVNYAFNSGIIVCAIYTNGICYDDPALLKFCRLGPPIVFAVSLDGCDEKSNDYIRGTGSFVKTMKFLEIIREERKKGSQIKCMIDTVVHPNNYERLVELFYFLTDFGFIDRWRASLPRAQGDFLKNQNLLELETSKVLAEYEMFIKWYLENGLKQCSIEVQIESFFQTEMIRRQEAEIFSRETYCCEYKKDALAIKPNGDITPCTSFTDFVVGNLNDVSLFEAWQSSLMQTVKTIKTAEVIECADCEYLYICGTGCRKIARQNKGSFFSKDDSICEIYRFFHEKIMPLLSRYDINFHPP